MNRELERALIQKLLSTSLSGAGTPLRHRLGGAGTPLGQHLFRWCGNTVETTSASLVREHQTGTGQGLRSRRIGKRAHCAWRINGFQDWERLKTLGLRGRGAQCYSPPYPDLEAEGKEGRPRTLKRARPTSFLPHVNTETALGLILKALPGYQTRRISTPG